MSIKRTIIATIAALALVATIAPVPASAVTIEELLAQIAQLQAQLTALQGSGTTTTTGGTYSACVGVTFTRYLTVGSTGADVKCMQQILNSTGYTLATTGAGSPGNETTYFGPRTLEAVKKWQAAQGWVPANQLGPKSIALMNSMISSGTGTGTGVIPTGSGLTVQMAYDNPSAGTVVDGQALAPYLKLTFVNGDNAEVTVTGLKLKRIGVSADDTVDNVYLFDGATRLTDGAAVSSTVVNFNYSTGLFKIPAGGSKTITVLGDTDGTAGETVGFQLLSASDITTNASSIKGSYPLTGNMMSLASGTLASVVFAATTNPSSNPTIDPQSDYSVFENSVVVHQRAVDLKRISFRKTGSVANSDIQNFRLYVDGVQVGSAVQNLNSEGYVTFDLTSSPKRLEAGTRVVKVLADIIGGSSLNFTMNLWNAADVTVTDSQYGANILIEATADGTIFSKRSTGTITVGSGVLSITKMTDSPSGNVIDGGSNITLAKFQLKASGERVKIESLKISARVSDSSVSGLRNGMLLANGVQIGSTTTLYDPADSSYDYTTFNLGSSLIVDPASPVTLEVKADIYDTGTGDTTDDLSTDDTIQVVIEGSSDENNALGMTSASTIDAPGSDVSANTLTVAAGSLTLSKYAAYTNRTVVDPVTNIKLGHFTLTSSTTEATNLNTIYVDLEQNNTVVENLYVKYGSNTTTVKANPSEEEDGNSWSINYQLPAGQTIDMEVWGDVNSLAVTNDYVETEMRVTGTTASSGTSVNSNGSTTEVTGQRITFGSGSAVVVVDGSTPDADSVAGNQEVTAAKFKFTASNDSYTITEVKVNVNDNDNGGSVIQYLTLTDGTNVYTQVYDAQNNYFNLTGLNVSVPANTTKVLTAKLMLTTPSTNGSTITTGRDVKLELNYVKALNSQGEVKYGYEEDDDGTDSGVTMTEGAITGNSLYVYKSIPTFAVGTITSQSTNLKNGSAGTQLYKFTVTADAKGDVALKQLKFYVTISDPDTTATARLGTFKFYRGETDLTALSNGVTIQNTSGTDLESTTSLSSTGTVIVTFNNEEVIGAGQTQTYYLKATPVGFGWHTTNGADSVSTYLLTDTDDSQDDSKYYLDTTSSIFKLESSAANDDEAFNVIWSDLSASGTDANTSAVGHDYTDGASSADWFAGYRVIDSNLDSISTVCTQ